MSSGVRPIAFARPVETRNTHTMKTSSMNAMFVVPYEVPFGNGRNRTVRRRPVMSWLRNAKKTTNPAATTWMTRAFVSASCLPENTATHTTKTARRSLSVQVETNFQAVGGCISDQAEALAEEERQVEPAVPPLLQLD